MKLKKIAIKGYKHLKNISIEFNNEAYSLGDFPVRFCIGLNGSGKSVFLEAVALIFSRAMYGKTAGFRYDVRYTLWKDGKEEEIRLYSDGSSLQIETEQGMIHDFSEGRAYLPYRVIACISGRNSQMKALLEDMARSAILDSLYELGNGCNPVTGKTETGVFCDWKIGQELEYLREQNSNTRCLLMEEELSVLVLFVLCAWRPGERAEEYEGLRKKLFETLTNGFEPAAVSLRAERANVSEGLFAEFFTDRVSETDGKSSAFSSESGDTINRVFLTEGGKLHCDVPVISRDYTNPMTLLSVLLQARSEGALRECHVFFHLDGSRDLLDEKALSDGELSWIARMGLVLLAGQRETDNCLFLFDEPDVHLNESWNVGFVSMLRELSETDGGRLHHEFLVSTHSSLILTDALPEQLYLFERKEGNASVKNIPVSSFGADRSEISRMLFANRATVGSYSEKVIERILDEEQSPEQLWKYIEETGPGINRFQMLDKYYAKDRE